MSDQSISSPASQLPLEVQEKWTKLMRTWLQWNFDLVLTKDSLTPEHELCRELAACKFRDAIIVNSLALVQSNIDFVWGVCQEVLYERASMDKLVEVADRVYLGCYPAVCSLKKLREQKITHIVNAASKYCRSPFVDDIEYLNLSLNDMPHQSMRGAMQQATKFLVDALASSSDARVAVHCQAGISRSVTLLCAFLMRTQKLTLVAALSQIREARSIAQPNQGFLRQLIDEEIEIFGQASMTKPLVLGYGREYAIPHSSVDPFVDPFVDPAEFEEQVLAESKMCPKCRGLVAPERFDMHVSQWCDAVEESTE